MNNNFNFEFRSQWRSTTSYLLVTIGAVVGLGNIIQFPYFVTQYGGLFILFYVLCELLISIPLFFAELFIGRCGKQNPVGSIGILTSESNGNKRWRLLGWYCAIISFLTLAYYTVQAAFPLGYLIGSTRDLIRYGVDEPIAVSIRGIVMSEFLPLEICFILLLIVTMFVIARGINRGLEVISRIVVPTYFTILLVLAIYVCFQGKFIESIRVLFAAHPNISVVTIFIAAASYALFKLGVGMGTMIVYGSYLPYTTSFARSTSIVVCFDAIISLLAFFIVYPVMLQSGGFIADLNNYNIIRIFKGYPYGILIAALYFLCATMAAWTCTIAMAETTTVTIIERFNINRKKAALIILIAAILVGTFSVVVSTTYIDNKLFHIELKGIIKHITGDYLVPISALFIAIFVGWVIRHDISEAELEFNSRSYKLWLFLVRYVAPVVILLVTIGSIVL